MILIFLILISYSLALIPEWNLNKSGKNVLLTTDKYQYTVFSKNIFPEKLEMIKRIEKSDNGQPLCEREQYYIKLYRTYVGYDDCNGYNLTIGGDGRPYIELNAAEHI